MMNVSKERVQEKNGKKWGESKGRKNKTSLGLQILYSSGGLFAIKMELKRPFEIRIVAKF